MYCPMQLCSTAQQLCPALCMRIFTVVKVSNAFTDQTFNEAQVAFIPAKSFPGPTKREAKGPCFYTTLPLLACTAQTELCTGSHCNKSFCCYRPGAYTFFSLSIWYWVLA